MIVVGIVVVFAAAAVAQFWFSLLVLERRSREYQQSSCSRWLAGYRMPGLRYQGAAAAINRTNWAAGSTFYSGDMHLPVAAAAAWMRRDFGLQSSSTKQLLLNSCSAAAGVASCVAADGSSESSDDLAVMVHDFMENDCGDLVDHSDSDCGGSPGSMKLCENLQVVANSKPPNHSSSRSTDRSSSGCRSWLLRNPTRF